MPQYVTGLCAAHSDLEPARSWLYFDLPDESIAKFVIHSVFRNGNGEYLDVTPSNAGQEYPFISSNLAEEDDQVMQPTPT